MFGKSAATALGDAAAVLPSRRVVPETCADHGQEMQLMV
jgi:hypothetical protein